MKTLLIVVLGFAGGFAGRGIFETLDAPWWGSILVYAPLFVGTLWVSRRLDKETKRETRRSSDPFGMPIITSEHVPPGQVVIMSTAMRDLIMKTQPRPFQEFGTRPSEHRPYLKMCLREWVTKPACRISYIMDGKHHCNRNMAHTLRDDCCLCDCGQASPKVERSDDEAWRTAAADRGVPECGYRWGALVSCFAGVEGGRTNHYCVSPQAHEVEDDFPHHCHCGSTLTHGVRPPEGEGS